MDIRMPRMNGVEATRRIAESGVPSRVIILTTVDLDEHVHDVLRAGAGGFLVQDGPADFLVTAIRTVAEGDAGSPRASPADSRTASPDSPTRPLPPSRAAWAHSPRGSGMSCAPSAAACPTPRSPRNCTSARRP
ncbi:response regulator [Streptomyces sp. NPDC005708]|uniref:response regulator n=1 Tax=Streptomyces sp. NPDC005708 TaxID=3154564 RepID=UPI0033C4EC58